MSNYLIRSPGNPPAWALCPGKQHDNPNRLYAVICHTQYGDIPGKAIGNQAWFPYGGDEHLCNDFSYISGGQGFQRNSGSTPPNACPLGHQNDSHGTVYVALAHTQYGDIPGKAKDNTCWYPYGGKEHLTNDFSWIVNPLCHNGHLTSPQGLWGMPHGHQNDGAGDVWVAIAHTQWGEIPGKAQGNTCWYAYGGNEHYTNNFSWVVGHAHLVHVNQCQHPQHPALGHQNDGAGSVWPAIANTQWGTIPGKAIGNTCWYPYGGKEYVTNDFCYVVPH
jgi:hypothetical protein